MRPREPSQIRKDHYPSQAAETCADGVELSFLPPPQLKLPHEKRKMLHLSQDNNLFTIVFLHSQHYYLNTNTEKSGTKEKPRIEKVK